MSLRTLRGGIAIAALALLAGAVPASGDSEDARNRVSFRVERSREVENDWVSAVIGVTFEDSDPARLADRINGDMSWALETAQARQGIRVRSAGYRTFPVEDPKRAQLRRWRGSQDLIVEGADAKLVSDLLGELQSRLQLRSIVFRVSPERLQTVETELVDEALDAFRARAEDVRAKLGARGYEIVHIQVETPGGPPVTPVRMQAMARAEAGVTPPALEGGTSTLRVAANATIELEF
jgi:predicted secreted protein